MTDTINEKAKLAVNTLMNVLKELILHSDKYQVSLIKFNTLVKAYNALERFPQKTFTGYIDISANTHLPGGALDYSSFTIHSDSIEIYTGFVSYEDGECDNSSWEKLFSSQDRTHRNNLSAALECWAEGFLLHIVDEPNRALLIIDRSEK